MYVAVKGGEKAISSAHRLLDEERRGNPEVAEIGADQIAEQLTLGVDRVMSEGALYDKELASIAIKQARGDLIEAIFLVRAFRTTLPRFGYSQPLNTAQMNTFRRISGIFKDIPGGQILGPTFDYTHRLINFDLLEKSDNKEDVSPSEPVELAEPEGEYKPKVLDLLARQGLIEPATPQEDEGDSSSEVGDITRDPLSFPADRDIRLQALARGDEGFLLALGYSTQRGYGRTHPFAGEIRFGEVMVEFVPEELGFAIEIAAVEVTECEMVNQFKGSKGVEPSFTRGYGLAFGQLERKAMSMALVDRSLRADEFDETRDAPAQDEEFVLSHLDNVQSTGFVEHLKLPHYVDFQAELELLRRMRTERCAQNQSVSTEQNSEQKEQVRVDG